MFNDTVKAIVRNCGMSRYSAGGKMEDCYSEVQELETAWGTLTFVDIKISNQHPVACCSRALLATLSPFMFVCVCVFGG